ncbi:cytochrome b/b6 domain-containing protein [Pseudarthrobacter sp. B907]|uniref:cytochrome b/b6 domain-containing protein n=1 Tax=Pseudarthrobacter sp. B907 TaxID=3158261 RepID=UPI0032DA06EA
MVSAPAAAQETAPATTALSAPVLAAGVPSVTAPAAGSGARQLRRGLPRVPGGEPWPPAGVGPLSAAPVSEAPVAAAEPATATPAAAPTPAAPIAPVEEAVQATTPASAATAAAPTPGTAQLRRGLPRVPGGEPWPPAGLAPAATAPTPAPVPAPTPQAVPEPAAQAPAPAEVPAAVVLPETASEAKPPAATRERETPPAAAAPPAVVEQPAKPSTPAKPKTEAKLYGSRTLAQWVKRIALLAVAAIAAAGILILAARGVTTLPGVPAFLERYPGEYHLPETAEQGFPWWAQWAHFFNFFLMALIIRSGYQVRTQQKPPAFWTPKRGGKKISITLWLHQSLDILWLANGLIFAVLLFASGHWMRIVPTSWEVFPNAASALLQYLTLDWPVENGWVNYNSLQQLMYFLVVFIAAPLAAITGVRMSEFWPKNATTLNKAYPVEVARALHFPAMLFFVLFILIHVFLVFATGALRNLNHMFAGTDEVNWVGFWLFAAAIAITTAGWYAARPIVLAPIARLFGKISSR